jgi:hypothetical protein
LQNEKLHGSFRNRAQNYCKCSLALVHQRKLTGEERVFTLIVGTPAIR